MSKPAEPVGEGQTSGVISRLVAFFGLKRSIAGLLGMVVLVGMGEHMAEQFLPVYLLAVGGGVLSIGILNAMDNLLGALYAFPGGYLSDRFGAKRALLFFNLLSMVGFLIVILIPRWEAVLAGAVFFLSWTAISLPATMSLIARVLPKNKHTMGVSLHSLVRRLPMALGPLLGGLCIAKWGVESGVRIAFSISLVMAVVAAILQQVLIEDEPAGPKAAEPNPFRLWRFINGHLRRLLVADILVRFCEQIPYAFVVVWAMNEISSPVTAPQFGILRAVEMATAILIYIPVAYAADRTHKKPFVVATFVFFTLFPLVLLWSQSFGALIFEFIIRGLKEFGEPTRKSLILALAPEDKKAGVFGLYYLIRDCIVSLAAIGGAFLWRVSPEATLLAAAGFGAIGTVWFAFAGSDLEPCEKG
jgi:predicted MFS family arabinose efflux permease